MIGDTAAVIHTPDRRLRVFVSSTLGELADERTAVREAVEQVRLTPIMFEIGARPHPPRALYRTYLQQSDVFVGVYWQRYGWVAPDEDLSGLEDEYRRAAGLPQLVYIKEPAPAREPRLADLLGAIQRDDRVSYRRFSDVEELKRLVQDDLALLLSERFHPITDTERPSQPPLPSAPPPMPLDATLGREADVEAVAGTLRRGARWVTLTGAGGIGKSRLALETARAVADDFPGGVVFVPLDPITDPALVLPTIARRVGARERPADLLDAAAEALGDRPTLLLLDNFEQVVRAATDVLSLLDRCPHVSVLVTSRQVVRVRGEHEYRVPPLSERSAVDLFAERAAAVRSGFVLTEENRPTISEICRRLDGLPLAIELAAAQIRLLSPDALLAQLAQRMELGRGAVDLPARQQTVRATMDWSYDLLTSAEQDLFARLAVFSGGWSLDAAVAVCQRPAEPDVLETLAGLLEKSLVLTTADDSASEPRLRMLEPVRAYAAEKLTERSDRRATEDCHTAWMRSFMRQARAGIDSAAHKRWMERLDQERANLRATIGRSLDAGDGVTVSRLLRDGLLYLHFRDAEQEAVTWVDRALGRATEADTTRGRLLAIRALATTSLGEYATARSLMCEGRSLVPDDAEHAVEWAMLDMTEGICASADAPADVAMPAMEKALRRYAALRDTLSLALCETTMGGVALRAGDLEDAGRHCRAALALADEVDNDPLRGHALTMLGGIALSAGRAEDATSLLCDAARVNRDSGQQSTTAYSVEGLAAVLLADGKPELAVRALAAATAARSRIGHPRWQVYVPFVEGLTARLRSSLSDVEYETGRAEGAGWSLSEALDRAVEALSPP